MYQGTLPPRSNKAGWSYLVEVLDDDTDEAVDISACTVVFELRDPRSQTTALSGTTDNGRITLSAETGIFIVSFTATDMRQLYAITYELGCTITNADSEPQQLIIGYVPILDGIVS